MASLLNVPIYFTVYFEGYYPVTSKRSNIQYILLLKNKLKSKERYYILATFKNEKEEIRVIWDLRLEKKR